MRVNYRKFIPRVGILIIVGLVASGSIVRWSRPSSPVLGGLAYPIQERVHNYVHILVQPVWYSESGTWLFSVRLKSTQNTRFLTIPLDTVAYIQTDRYGSQVPQKWAWDQQDTHETHGYLTWSPVSEGRMPDAEVMDGGGIALVVYVDEPIQFTWTSPSNLTSDAT